MNIILKGFVNINGYDNMKLKYGYSVANTTLYSTSMCGLPPKDYLNLLRDVDSDLPWTGRTFNSLNYLVH